VAYASVLLVDDDGPFREAVCRALTAQGYRVQEAVGGQQALRVLAAEAPDLLITDMIMPAGDGVEVIIAAKRRHPATRILAISGHANLGGLDLLKMAIMIGADEALPKPFSTDELLLNIDGLMAPARQL
jgi:DNA-binding response OmpR family regulator